MPGCFWVAAFYQGPLLLHDPLHAVESNGDSELQLLLGPSLFLVRDTNRCSLGRLMSVHICADWQCWRKGFPGAVSLLAQSSSVQCWRCQLSPWTGQYHVAPFTSAGGYFPLPVPLALSSNQFTAFSPAHLPEIKMHHPNTAFFICNFFSASDIVLLNSSKASIPLLSGLLLWALCVLCPFGRKNRFVCTSLAEKEKTACRKAWAHNVLLVSTV